MGSNSNGPLPTQPGSSLTPLDAPTTQGQSHPVGPNPTTQAYFKKLEAENWRPYGKPYKYPTAAAWNAAVKEEWDDLQAELGPLAVVHEPHDDPHALLDENIITKNNIKIILDCLEQALILEPQLRCPLPDDVDGWRRTLRGVFGTDAPNIACTTASHIAHGNGKYAPEVESAEVPTLRAWAAASVRGDKAGRFVLQPISKSHVYVVMKGLTDGALSSLAPNFPPTLMERWVAAVTKAAETLRRSTIT
ncbi:hypothetical protein Q8F55_002696 [Vanrija albida]|uniref:Uncharacterized protein n=1 Tax=Vanrija albida TaxID=181172 RepID=A0ABR3QAJ6_9TREE